ncbi:TonB-dependent siderophore receptor [Novosphingobium sp. 1949]|uniref:TonB-dependent siderophore receptor n=1 Tax=Novosphingobium organovorum TaxID=2930092 RepID=A0ABT0BAH5_9SPHN|nr:TonB-dependent siderophore receptor [Novosphingobium organovorum]MCJ2182067.1 TonB-dependent siderophore receptor [Novosphingobium organovorum]
MKYTATAIGLVLAVSAAPAFAQQSSTTETAKTYDESKIVVTATGYSSATSATKTDAPIIESPQSISIISAEEIELRASPNIADALAYTAGVQAEPSGQDSRTDEVSVRGFGAGGFSSNNNFVDGLRLPSGGQWTRPGFDTFALQQIEVLKGPSGALYGQTAPGGVVNLVTKRPTDTFQAQFMLQAIGTTDLGNWNYEAASDVSGPITSTLSGRVVALARYGATQIDGVDQGRKYISPSLTWKPDADTTWTLLGQYQRDDGGATFQFLPSTGSLYASNGKHIANDANLGEPDWNTFDRNQYLAASFFEHRFGDSGLTIRNNTRFTHIDTLYRVTVSSGDTVTDCSAVSITGCIDGATLRRRAVQGDGHSDGLATDTQLQYDVNTGAIEHKLLGGFDYFHTNWTHYRDLVSSSLVLPVLDIFNPVSRGSDGFAENMTPQVYTHTVSDQYGLYAQDQMSWGHLHVTAGLRHDWAKDDTTNLLTLDEWETKSNKFTWRLGGVYMFDNGLAAYASYATSFLPEVSDPSYNLTGKPFKPTTGQQYEGGLRYQSGNNIYLTLGGYQITQQNMISSDPDGTLCGTATCKVQLGEGRVRGLEFEAKASLPFGLAVIATATRNWTDITKSYVTSTSSSTSVAKGNHLPQIPEWMASLFLSQKIEGGVLAGLNFGGGVRYTGKSYGDAANTLEIPDYALFDTFVRYQLASGVTASLNARNLADKRYVATCTAASACYYGQGRSVTARLDFRW